MGVGPRLIVGGADGRLMVGGAVGSPERGVAWGGTPVINEALCWKGRPVAPAG